MPSPVLRRNEVWPLNFALNESEYDGSGALTGTVQNLEFTDPQSHVFHGYTQKLSDYAATHNEDFKTQYPERGEAGYKPTKAFWTYNKKSSEEAKSQSSIKDEYKIKHLIAGGIAGCVASTVTCPLDVIKTRQQSSGHASGLSSLPKKQYSTVARIRPKVMRNGKILTRTGRMQMTQVSPIQAPYFLKVSNKSFKSAGSSSILQHYRYIMKIEGARSLYKGLGPTLVGVVPSRAIYFFAYSNAKNFLTKNFGFHKDTSSLHLFSAASAGVCCTTATSPLWVIKTKLQLHRSVQSTMTVRECCTKIWQAGGMRGFYRGITASYAGILETVIHFVIYERLKLWHMKDKSLFHNESDKTWKDYTALMGIAAMSKTTATCVAYPHEVVRTRLREETKQKKYRGFFQTLFLVAKQEGVKALYRGLGTQIVRQVPNMAIIMGTYEFIIDISSKM